MKTSNGLPVYTKSLALLAFNVVVLSYIFTAYQVDVPMKEAFNWSVKQLYKVDVIKNAIHKVSALVGYTGRPKSTKKSKDDVKIKAKVEGLPILTKEQLALFDGTRPSKPVYLALLGRIYDVQKGRKHYAPGGGYHFFAGKDATRAFVTGDFTEGGLSDDVSGLSEQELLSIADWVKFYERDYKLVGFLEGTYYTLDGKHTERLNEVNALLEGAEEWKMKQMKESEVFPPCNSEWSQNKGGRVWCTNKSGGISRNWVGVPRRLFNPATKSYRCACVKNFGTPLANPEVEGNRGDLDNPNLKEYDECSPTSNSCKLPSE